MHDTHDVVTTADEPPSLHTTKRVVTATAATTAATTNLNVHTRPAVAAEQGERLCDHVEQQ
jgi:hypothetical protein